MSAKEGDRPRPGDRIGTERFERESGASGSGAGEDGGAIRVVVVGNQGTGKTSLIISCLTEAFPEEPVPVLPPTRYLADSFSDKIPLLIVDTSSRREERGAVEAELRAADAVVITFACDDQASLNSVSSYWLPLLRQLQVPVPVVVVGCKLDLRGVPGAVAGGGGAAAGAGGAGGAGGMVAQQPLDVLVAPIMDEFKEVETCLECSALRRIQVAEVFFFAQRAVLHPTGPLFDRQTQALRPACVRALMRIFMLCDVDGDGVLSDNELNAFQVECFSVPLQPAELVGVKRVVAEKMVDGVAANGLTLTGFLFLHALFIERGRLETTWTVLRKFGYSSTLHLRAEITQLPSKPLPDQSVELSTKALEFVCARFRAFDNDQDGALNTSELNNLFSTAPNSPWEEAPYLGAAEASPSGALTFSGYLSLWSLMALLHPERAIEYLLYLGFPSDLAPSALTFTRRRRSDRKAGSTQRRVLQCLVVGPAQAGKTALLNSLLGRPFEPSHIKCSEDERFAVNLISTDPQAHSSSSSSSSSSSTTTASSLSSSTRDSSSIASQDLGTVASSSTVLVLREVHPDALPRLLAEPNWLAACDVAAFVYDSSSQGSWEKAVGMLQEVAGRAEATESEMPAVLVAAKNDLEPHPAIFTQSAQLCTEMGVAAPVPVSSLLHDVNELWVRLADAARKPHVGIPETSASRSSKALRRRLLYRSVSVALVGTAVAVVLVVGFRIYAARRSSSSA
ncbi:hypothetical protein CLOM_g14555 [Closterium sp. NIES-68]|nr:hypothetical protein CLOM_g14555 [Closterium sp. NIES-68]GJP62997.1 hypothetical protein CLOP_g20050 [Closterium sp. NIES-67]